MKYGKWLGVGVTVLGLLASVSIVAQGAKITWDKNGKPIIEKSNKPVKGCNQDLGIDSNKTLEEKYNPADIFKPKKKKGCK